MISFGARYINSAQVQKISYVNDFIGPVEVSCVELNPKNANDVNAVMDLVDMWDSNEKYEEIVGLNMYASSEDELTGDVRYYALTEQEDDFENLNPSDILALSQVNVKGGKDVELEYLQVKPEPRLIFSTHTIKRAGCAMLDSLKNIFKGFKITLFSNITATGFYEKNNFKEDELIPGKFTYDA